MKKAFSLVELSIVLVILGLLTGGILAGKSLIRASELRSVGTEYQRYLTSVHAFRDKYFAIPGDMANATGVWGKDNTNCAGHAGVAATPGTCNGNADGQLSGAGSASGTGENFQFWKQLSLAGLIEGDFSGIAGATNTVHMIGGRNVPASRANNAIWGMREYLGGTYADGTMLRNVYDNWMQLGGATNGENITAAFLPEEAWNIDTKQDDGKPGTGKIVSRWWSGCTTASSNAQTTADYRLDSTTTACTMLFPRIFGG